MKKVKTFSTLIFGSEKFDLNKQKMLIGSAENCDICLEHDSVSFYHAMIFVDDIGTVTVIDLQSTNGSFINGQRLAQKTSLFEGDTLSLGKMHADIITTTSFEVTNQEEKVTEYSELQDQKVYVPQATHENDILIDDEYCDILFNDQEFNPLQFNPLKSSLVDKQGFIETDQLEEAFDIRDENQDKCIQITTTSAGAIIEQYYFPMQEGHIYAHNQEAKNSIVIDILKTTKPVEFMNITNAGLSISDVSEFKRSQTNLDFTSDDVIVMTQGIFQVFIEIAPAPAKLGHISSFIRDKDFYKETIKKFGAVILPMLLLLLVDFSIEKKKPLKQLSIIYKKPTNANVNNNKMASENPNNTKKDTGHKSTKQPDKKIAHSKSGEKSQPKKAPEQKVATSAPSKAESVTKAKTKAYKFNMKTNVNSIFSQSKSASVSNSRSVSDVQTTSTVTGSLNTKVNGTSSKAVGNMGSDSAGRSVASFGSKGLSSKAGRDTAYIQTETVVLGSMDPELLRKILQQYLPQFRHCYQQELVYNSEDIKGVVDLNFEISGGGKVGKINITAKDSRFSKKGIDCMGNVLAIIDFPKPKGGGRVAVRQPLSFFSEKQKG